jgi:hypothetical protein
MASSIILNIMTSSTISLSQVNNQNILLAPAISNNSSDLLQQLVFIDPQIENYQLLTNNIADSASVFLLNPAKNGIDQISNILKDY